MKPNIKLLIIFFILLISFILLINISEPDVDIKEVEYNPNNIVINVNRPKYYNDIIHAGLNELEIDGIKIYVLPVRFKNMDDMIVEAHVKENRGNFFLFIDEYSKKKSLKILSHELIHIKQHYFGHILIDNDDINLEYKGKKYNLNEVKYKDRPWEIDAFIEGAELEKKIIK